MGQIVQVGGALTAFALSVLAVGTATTAMAQPADAGLDSGVFFDAEVRLTVSESVNADGNSQADAGLNVDVERKPSKLAAIRWTTTDDGVLVLTNRPPATSPVSGQQPVSAVSEPRLTQAAAVQARAAIHQLNSPVPPARRRQRFFSFSWAVMSGVFALGLVLWGGGAWWSRRPRG